MCTNLVELNIMHANVDSKAKEAVLSSEQQLQYEREVPLWSCDLLLRALQAKTLQQHKVFQLSNKWP